MCCISRICGGPACPPGNAQPFLRAVPADNAERITRNRLCEQVLRLRTGGKLLYNNLHAFNRADNHLCPLRDYGSAGGAGGPNAAEHLRLPGGRRVVDLLRHDGDLPDTAAGVCILPAKARKLFSQAASYRRVQRRKPQRTGSIVHKAAHHRDY